MTKAYNPDPAVNLRTLHADPTLAIEADSLDRAYKQGGEIVLGVVNALDDARLWEAREVVEAGAAA